VEDIELRVMKVVSLGPFFYEWFTKKFCP